MDGPMSAAAVARELGTNVPRVLRAPVAEAEKLPPHAKMFNRGVYTA